MHAHGLTASDIATLEDAAGDARDLIVETIEAAKGQGHDVDFIAMSDALRESPNRGIYETLMQDILALDENKRDLLMRAGASDGEDARDAERRDEQRALQAHELRDAIRRMRDQAIAAELARLSSAGLGTDESLERYRALLDERTRLRQG